MEYKVDKTLEEVLKYGETIGEMEGVYPTIGIYNIFDSLIAKYEYAEGKYNVFVYEDNVLNKKDTYHFCKRSENGRQLMFYADSVNNYSNIYSLSSAAYLSGNVSEIKVYDNDAEYNIDEPIIIIDLDDFMDISDTLKKMLTCTLINPDSMEVYVAGNHKIVNVEVMDFDGSAVSSC